MNYVIPIVQIVCEVVDIGDDRGMRDVDSDWDGEDLDGFCG